MASPSSCVSSSCSSDSEEDDLCSIDGTDMTEYLERRDISMDGDEDKSECGRASRVSCSVAESEADHVTDQVSRLLSLLAHPLI